PWTFSQGSNSCSKARLQAGPGSFPSVQVFNQRAWAVHQVELYPGGVMNTPRLRMSGSFIVLDASTSAICQMAWLSFMSSSMPFRKVESQARLEADHGERGSKTAALLRTIAACEPASMNISQDARMEDFPEMFVSP